MVFDGWKQSIIVKGQKLKIEYPIKEQKDRIVILGKIADSQIPQSVDSMKLVDNMLVIVPVNEECSYELAAKIIKEILKI